MLRQPIRDLPEAGTAPQSWALLATERLREFHARIAALDALGKPSYRPENYRTFPSAAEAEAWHREVRASGRLDDAQWTYTIFRMA